MKPGEVRRPTHCKKRDEWGTRVELRLAWTGQSPVTTRVRAGTITCW